MFYITIEYFYVQKQLFMKEVPIAKTNSSLLCNEQAVNKPATFFCSQLAGDLTLRRF